MKVYITIEDDEGNAFYESESPSIDVAIDNMYSLARNSKTYKKELKKELENNPF